MRMVRGGCKRPLSSAFDELPFHSRGGAAGAGLSNPTQAFSTVTLRAETRRKGGVRGDVDENRRAINQRNLAMPPSRARRCGSHGENVDRRHQIWTRSQTHSAVARPADWLLGASVVTPAASSWRPVPTFPMRAQMAFSKPDHPLFSPLVDGTTIQKPTHAMSRPCVSPLDLPSPHQVVHKYISLDTGISRRLNMPAATSPTSLLLPLF